MRPYGFSTGAFHWSDVNVGIEVNREVGATALEVSALDEAQLEHAAERLARGVSGFGRVSVHGPALGRRLADEELSAHLAGTELPVVMHPYAISDLRPWRRLGRRLLVENSDARKPLGQGPGDLDEVFELVPEAGMCLDVSHALHAGGRSLALELAERYADRVEQLHVGCACGERVGPDLDEELLETAARVLERCSPEVAVIGERMVIPVDVDLARRQVRTLARLAAL